MSEMIERVARRLAKAQGFELVADLSLPYAPGSRIGIVMRLAREAVEEMLNPTRAMDSAGYDAYPDSVLKSGVDHLDVYRAMINAALGLPPSPTDKETE